MAFDFHEVRARGVVKMFGLTRALVGVDATFEAGTVTVVEGPNGSGKSTLLNILAQLVRPTRGEVRYGNRSGKRGGAPLRSRIGVLSHAAMLYPDLDAHENLGLFARLYGIAGERERIKALCERFEIGAYGKRPARTWSRGQLQRVGLARALLHSPRLVLLDEPSTGLDESSVDRLVEAVEAERERGAIQILVTHDPSLAARVADKKLRLAVGKVLQA